MFGEINSFKKIKSSYSFFGAFLKNLITEGDLLWPPVWSLYQGQGILKSSGAAAEKCSNRLDV